MYSMSMENIYDSVEKLNRHTMFIQTYINGLDESIDVILDMRPTFLNENINNYIQKVKRAMRQIEGCQTISVRYIVNGIIKSLPPQSAVGLEEKEQAIKILGFQLKIFIMENCISSPQFRRQRVCYHMNCQNRVRDFLK